MERKNIDIKLLEVNKGQVEGLPRNPRTIRDERFRKLVKSIEDSPEMLEYRTLLVYPHEGKYVIVCGNMRYRACREIGYSVLPCVVLPQDTTSGKLREYAIKDNIGFGDDDWQALKDEWNSEELTEWGVEVKDNKKEDEDYQLFEEPQQLFLGKEYILVICDNNDEFEDARKHFGLGFVKKTNGAKKIVKSRTVKWLNYVNSNTKQE